MKHSGANKSVLTGILVYSSSFLNYDLSGKKFILTQKMVNSSCFFFFTFSGKQLVLTEILVNVSCLFYIQCQTVHFYWCTGLFVASILHSVANCSGLIGYCSIYLVWLKFSGKQFMWLNLILVNSTCMFNIQWQTAHANLDTSCFVLFVQRSVANSSRWLGYWSIHPALFNVHWQIYEAKFWNC